MDIANPGMTEPRYRAAGATNGVRKGNTMKRMLLTLALLLLLGVAFAQEPEATLANFQEWFSNPAVGVAAVAGFVTWLRRVRPGIDGPVTVPAFALGAGAVGGALGQLAGMLAVDPFTGLTFPLGGIGYGLACAVGAVFGVNLFEMLSGKLGKALIGLVRGSDETVDPDPADTAAASRLRRG